MFFSVRRKATQSSLIQDASTSDSQVTHASTFQHERPATASISVVECRRRQPGDGVYAQWWRRGKYLCNRTEKGRWLVSCCPGSKAKDALPPLPLKPLNISFKKKHTHTHPNPYSSSSSFSSSTPQPLTLHQDLLYKPGTDVCWSCAERPRCSGCQPHAFHSEMKAHSSPSCEANFRKKKKGMEKKTLSKCL